MSVDAVEFERHRADVDRWAYRIVGRHQDALDVAQDVFLRWLRQRAAAPPANLRAWLRQVTINRAIDVVRGKGANPLLPAKGDWHLLLAKGERPAAEQEELRVAISHALAALTDAQRSVLVAKVYDGLTFAAIGGEMDIAVPTAKTHYLRALDAVRDELRRRKLP